MRYIASLLLVICCGVVAAQQANVKIDVSGKNDPPAAVNDVYETDQDTVLVGNLLDNDYDPDVNDTTVVVKVNGQAITPGETITLPSGALLTVNADGSFSYNPNGVWDALGEGEADQESFDYEIANPNDGDSPTVMLLPSPKKRSPIQRLIGDALVALRTKETEPIVTFQKR